MRVVQGLVGAPMVPLALGLLFGGRRGSEHPGQRRNRILRPPALGPAIGGLLISGFGWRSVFLINVPIGLAALAAALAAAAMAAAGTRVRR